MLLATGFALEACGGDGPQDVAERFWEAARDRDAAALEALSLPSDNTEFDLDNEDAQIWDLEIGSVAVEDGVAEVETKFKLDTEDLDIDVEFMTMVARHDGEWLVDMDETTGEIMKAVIGASMAEIGEAIGEGLHDAMEGIAEGLAEGMEELTEELEEATEKMRKDNR